MWRFLCFLALYCSVLGDNIGNTRQPIVHYEDGGYGQILIAIDDNVEEDRSLIDAIQVYNVTLSYVAYLTREAFTCSIF